MKMPGNEETLLKILGILKIFKKGQCPGSDAGAF
jgi:hypothetical protein